jgi:HEPN domain-containing protein
MVKQNYSGMLYASKNHIDAILFLSEDVATNCEMICFHAQQAAETMIKNAYMENHDRFKKIHELDVLLQILIEKDLLNAEPREMTAASELTSYAVATRYKFAGDISVGEAKRAIMLCKQIAAMLKRNGYAVVEEVFEL